MIRKKNLYARPRKPFEKTRIEEENVLRKKYGLKNKTEIWKTLARVNYFRKRAMSLTNASQEEQDVFFKKLKDIDLKVNSIADVLGLGVEDLLRRRLPSVVQKKGIATTVKQARQMVAHKRILIQNNVVDSPSYLVKVHEEHTISLRKKEQKSEHKAEAHVETAPGVEHG